MKKKIFGLILCLGVVLFITGCGNQEASNNEKLDSKSESSEQSDGVKTIICKGKSNDFASVADNMKSATRIETYVVSENKVTDYSVNVEVVLDDKKYTKKEVDELVERLQYFDYVTSKKSDYVINFKATNPLRWFDGQEYEDTANTVKKSAEIQGYKCTVK